MERKPRNSAKVSMLCLLLASLLASQAGLAQHAAFRFVDLDLRDPHVFVSFVSCWDVTDTPLVGFSVNGELQQRIQTDANSDGRLDLSYLIEFLPLDIGQSSNLIEFGTADCSAPAAATHCTPVITPAIAGDATLLALGTCAAPLPGTLLPYTPAITSSGAPCFVSPAGNVTLDVGGIPVTLQQTTVAATFVGDPITGLVNGLLRGFLTESDANAALLPANNPLMGNQPVSALLPGGTGNCAPFSDMDTLDDVPGWWFYLNFTALRVPLIDPFANGFRDGFESP